MDDQILTKVKADLSWLQKHERIVLAVIVALVLVFGANKALDKYAEVAHDHATVLQQQLDDQKTANKALDAKIDKLTSDWVADRASREADMTRLSLAIAQRDSAAKQNVERVLAPTDAKSASETLFTLYKGALAPMSLSGDGVLVPTGNLQQFSATKIQNDACQADLIDTNAKLDTALAGESQATGLVGQLQTQVVGKNKEIADADTAHKAEVKDIKAAAAKSSRKWFVIGYAAGWASAIAVRVANIL